MGHIGIQIQHESSDILHECVLDLNPSPSRHPPILSCFRESDPLDYRLPHELLPDFGFCSLGRNDGMGKNLPKDCISRMEPSECIFPHELVKSIKTPFFILNPAYDFWQIQHILAPDASDRQRNWLRCKRNIYDCDSNQIEVLQVFRTSMLNALSEFQQNEDGGMFINSCFVHCQTMSNITWHSPKSPRIKNKTIAEAVGDWYFDRSEVKLIDCPYPCNPTCYNLNFN